MFGNYKLNQGQTKTLRLQLSASSCLTQTGNVNLRFLLGPFLHISSPPTFCPFPARSLVQSGSIWFLSPSFPLLCTGMCFSAVADENVVNRAPLCACVFMFHIVAFQARQETGAEKRKRGRHADRLKHFHWDSPTQKLDGYSALSSGQLLSVFSVTMCWKVKCFKCYNVLLNNAAHAQKARYKIHSSCSVQTCFRKFS